MNPFKPWTQNKHFVFWHIIAWLPIAILTGCASYLDVGGKIPGWLLWAMLPASIWNISALIVRNLDIKKKEQA